MLKTVNDARKPFTTCYFAPDSPLKVIFLSVVLSGVNGTYKYAYYYRKEYEAIEMVAKISKGLKRQLDMVGGKNVHLSVIVEPIEDSEIHMQKINYFLGEMGIDGAHMHYDHDCRQAHSTDCRRSHVHIDRLDTKRGGITKEQVYELASLEEVYRISDEWYHDCSYFPHK